MHSSNRDIIVRYLNFHKWLNEYVDCLFKLNGEIDKELQTCRVSAIAAQRTKGSLNRVSMAPECLEGPMMTPVHFGSKWWPLWVINS